MEKRTEEMGNQEYETTMKETSVSNERTAGSQGEEEFKELYEESLKTFQEGEVVKGRIVSIDKDFVMVDIGYKSEGRIPMQEFLSPTGEITAKVGETVDVLIEKRDDEEGDILLSKDRAAKILVWDEISRIYREDGVIEGKIAGKVKGGLTVDIGLPAFLPGSQIDLQPVRDMDGLLGSTYSFKILKYNKKRNNVVLSRRVLLEKEREEQQTPF